MNWGDDASIFVAIAAYRDPELLATVQDCLAKAAVPERVRFGICLQYGPELSGSEHLSGPQFRVRYVDSRLSQGACWARAETMKLFAGEDWYLQLDSHHRFARDWDRILLQQAARTGSPRPVLSTYGASFTPGQEGDAVCHSTGMAFDRFIDEGVPIFAPICCEPRPLPYRARFVSAHFLFAPGSFVRDVPYDPQLYFIGEEITLAVRAFTHGYDLFHPGAHVLWHEYSRVGRPKHWDDHTETHAQDVAWHERDRASLAKAMRLLTESWQGADGMGTARSVEQYEAYAGISFRERRVEQNARLNLEPAPAAVADDQSAVALAVAATVAEAAGRHTLEIAIPRSDLPAAAVDDPRFWYVGAHDRDGHEVYREDAGLDELAAALANGRDPVTLRREFFSERTPVTWTVLPYSASEGWLGRVHGPATAPPPTIFVSVAAYRDPDLAPTVADALTKAAHPEHLRFGICWQHAPSEQLPDWMRGPQFEVLDVDWRSSRGGCWARAEIMKLWAGEDWFLQIDSHQRFAPDWDRTLVEQAKASGSPKPVLSAPAPAFTIGSETPPAGPLRTDFIGFRDNGTPILRPGHISPDRDRRTPMRARSVCGHLLFAPGRFAQEVPYDPDLYFSWEETTMALRAFTHGYDLFHPTSVVTWHEYSRDYRVKHWDDHDGKADTGVPWQVLRQQSLARVERFFREPEVGTVGLGEERSFADYEAYAGVSFGHRRIQDYTRRHREPPNPPADPNWFEQVRDHRIEIRFRIDDLPAGATTDALLWYVGVHDGEGKELFRQDVGREALPGLLGAGDGEVRIVREFSSTAVPRTWTVLPLSASDGWLPGVHGEVVLTPEHLPAPA